jgi:hypothetical protein
MPKIEVIEGCSNVVLKRHKEKKKMVGEHGP